MNLGNPAELTLTGLAEAIIEVTASSSEIVDAALPIDDPKVQQSDITRTKELLGWEPAVQLREGLARVVEFERGNRSHSVTALG